MSLADVLERAKVAGAALVAASRNLWSGMRLADTYRPGAPLKGFRLARTGKHRNTSLTRHEQTRNPTGSKFWKCREQWGGA